MTESRDELTCQSETSAKEYQKRMDDFQSSKEEYETKSKNVGKLEELLQTLTVGLAATEGQGNGYMDQLRGNIHITCLLYIRGKTYRK